MTAGRGIDPRDLDEALAHARGALAELDGASILVTGGTGFFGVWLVSLLVHARRALGLELAITILTRDPDRFAQMHPALARQDISLVRGDVLFFEFPKGRFSHVVHAATDTSLAADRDPAGLIETIVDGTKRVIEFATAAGVTRLLYVSSGAIYGPQPPDMDSIAEDYRGACDPLDPRSAYGQAKRLAEQMCVCAGATTSIETVIARAFAFVGPGLPLDGHFAIGNFIADAVRDRPVAVAGDGTPVRSYLYAADLAAWLVTLLVKGRRMSAYNVGSDRAVGIEDLARSIAAHSASGAVTIAGRPQEGAARSRYVPSIDKAREELGLAVWTDLDESVRRTVASARASVDAPPPLRRASPNEHGGQATIVIDVDGVVASLVPDNDYTKAEPLVGTIAAINRLYDRGCRIIMFTARGSATGLDWTDLTRAQFSRWGLRYHELRFGKPAGDFYVDDRLLSVGALLTLAGEIA